MKTKKSTSIRNVIRLVKMSQLNADLVLIDSKIKNKENEAFLIASEIKDLNKKTESLNIDFKSKINEIKKLQKELKKTALEIKERRAE